MASHYPDQNQWEHVDPEQMGINSEKLNDAIDFAKVNDTPSNLIKFDFSNHEQRLSDEGKSLKPLVHSLIVGVGKLE